MKHSDVLNRALANSQTCVLSTWALVAFAASAMAQGPFSPELVPTASFGNYLAGIEIADVNGDGRVDMITSGAGAGSVLLAMGQGRFAAPLSFGLPGSTATKTAIGDFDSDGNVDLVVGNWLVSSPTLRLLLNDGAGVFSTSATVSLGSGVACVAVGDLDGDTNLDVLAGRWTGAFELFVVRGDGAGGFLMSTSTALTDRALDLAVGDLNGDGALDVVTAKQTGGVTVLLGDGAGGFMSVQQYSHNLYSDVVALVDVDGDSDLDIFDNRSNASLVEVRLNNGLGVFGTPTFLTGAQPRELLATDLDGDGRADIVGVDYYGDAAVWRNLGGATFEPVRLFGAVASAPVALASSDLDGDGHIDLAVADSLPSSITLLWGDGAANLGHRRLPLPSLVVAPAVADLNGDARDDLITASNQAASVFVSLHQPTGDFVTTTLMLPSIPNTMSTGDINADGKLDLATTSGANVEVRFGNGNGTFAAPITSSLSPGVDDAVAADISGDQFADLVWSYWQFPGGAHLRASLSNGVGGFSSTLDLDAQLGSAFQIYGLTAGYFNQDNRADIVVPTSQGCVVVLSNGVSGFTSVTPWSGSAIVASDTADLDLDGNLDLVLASGLGVPKVRVFFGDGQGAFPTSLDFNLGIDPKAIEIGDFDADGDLDIVIVDVQGVVKLLAGDGLGGLSLLARAFPSEIYSDAGDYLSTGIRAFDVDLDGRLDLALTDERLPTVTFLIQRNAWEHPDAYCAAKTTSNGCVPSIGSSGLPSASATSGFTVHCADVINNKNGLLFYSLNGRRGAPFQGGTMCVIAPVNRTPLRNSAGNPPPDNCSGTFSIDMNSFAHGLAGGSPQPALLVQGTVVTAQWWGRDPAASTPTMLSNALEYLVGP